MKKTFILCIFMVMQMLNIAIAQSITEITPVLNACNALRDAISSGSNETLRNANTQYKQIPTKEFASLRKIAGEEISLNGHFVFDPVFIDSLIVNRKTYNFAQRYAELRTHRGTGATMGGKIFTKTSAIKKRSSIKYSFPSRGHQEIAVVTEPGGAVTLKIYDKTNDKWYRDTEDIREGKSYRSHAFDLPTNKISTLEVEITNTTDRDISFVIIGN